MLCIYYFYMTNNLLLFVILYVLEKQLLTIDIFKAFKTLKIILTIPTPVLSGSLTPADPSQPFNYFVFALETYHFCMFLNYYFYMTNNLLLFVILYVLEKQLVTIN